jgi:hypothetical protein
MNVKKWKILALNMKTWHDLVEKAKTHKGLSSSWKKKKEAPIK